MYGGLFEDLPAAKNVKNEAEDNASNAASKKTQVKEEANEQNKRQRVQEPKSAKGSSLVQTLGVAGTSMAFVPTHVNRKQKVTKRPKQQPKSISASNTRTTPATGPTQFVALSDIPENIVGKDTSSGNNHHQKDSTSISNPTVVSEPEELRRLHDNVTDPYDPLVPNDLLQFWERQAAILEREEIEREARATMEQQIEICAQLERERQEIEGKVNKIGQIVEHRQRNAMPPRGRGRGVSNLPAWVVEKQKKEAQLGLQARKEE